MSRFSVHFTILLCTFVLKNFPVLSTPLQPLPSLVIPSIIIPSRNSSMMDVANAVANNANNLLCEKNPTNLLCPTSVYIGHKIEANFPPSLLLRHCNVFIPSPHCCSQFCLPGTAGTCDQASGSCFCSGPGGPPNVCQMLVQTDDASTTTPGMTANDIALLGICKTQCANNPSGCTKAAGVTDGIVGTVCFCYCDKEQ